MITDKSLVQTLALLIEVVRRRHVAYDPCAKPFDDAERSGEGSAEAVVVDGRCGLQSDRGRVVRGWVEAIRVAVVHLGAVVVQQKLKKLNFTKKLNYKFT